MLELFYMGGSLFMGILTLILFVILTMTIRTWVKFSIHQWDVSTAQHNLTYIKSIGFLAFVFGIFGQLIGLYSAFVAIEHMGGISPAMLAGGLKVSMITTIYGALILMISILIWLFSDALIKNKAEQNH